MAFLLASLGLFLAGGCISLASGDGRTASRIGGGGAIAASLAGLVPAIRMLAESLQRPAPPIIQTLGKLPMGEFALRLDLVSAVFLVPVLIIVAVAAFYGMDNAAAAQDRDAPAPAAGHAGTHWFFYNLLAGGMVLTVTAADAFLFLLAWEVMSVAPFFLITLNGKTEQKRSAAWMYLVAAHLGALFLLAFFALLAALNGGSLSFAAAYAAAGSLVADTPGGLGLLFILALVGFGAKSGFVPFHIWMPEAYPAAPGHVAAVMSGAMVNMGVYGLIRAVMFLGIGETWWAYTLIGVGTASGALGILQALAQPTIKRALAFSSVENMGIICLGLGVALLCQQNNYTAVAAIAATGALAHMVNHALSKALLFLCAGSVRRGTGTVTLRLLGGLHKRMPVVGWCFALGCAAIAALPPLNGFAGEFFIYLGMVFGGTAFAHGASAGYGLVLWLGLFCLAGISGFTLLCSTRLYGMAFLGAPRTDRVRNARGPAWNETAAICAMALLCVFSAANAPGVVQLCHTAVTPVLYAGVDTTPRLAAAPAPAFPAHPAQTPAGFLPPRLAGWRSGPDSAITLLRNVNGIFLFFIAAACAAFVLRRRLMRGRTVGASPTWDCGYLAPTARMQYTPGSFSQPAAMFMRTILRPKQVSPEITEYFPIRAKAELITRDWVESKGFTPLFALVMRIADKSKEFQHGHSNLYILYILVTLVALLGWKLR